MKIIRRGRPHKQFDKDNKPVLRVAPGEEVLFETVDPLGGEVHNVDQWLVFLAQREKKSGGTLTGPVFVEGARPGDTLLVDILDIECDQPGFQLLGPDRAIVTDEVDTWTFHEVRVENGRVLLPNGIDLPYEPMIGTFGNAPAGEPTTLANRLGGNCDVPEVRVGARLYIPVEVNGALFSLTDVHARQGDGEIAGAPEIPARVTVRFGLLGRKHADWFMVEDDKHWYAPFTGKDEMEATRRAVFHNAEFISRTYDMTLADALILLTMIGRISISRASGEWGPHSIPVVTSSFPKELVSIPKKT